LKNKWVEHPLDKASRYREFFKDELRFTPPLLDAFGRLSYEIILDQKNRGALVDEMEVINLGDKDLLPGFYVLEFRSRVQLEILANNLYRTDLATKFNPFTFAAKFDMTLFVGSKRT
jgi:hypothetical protein